MNFDVIVVGGGHAGVEASSATSKLGLKTCMFCLNKKMIANMPCNPHIGGSAKGIVVREIDALGGVMGKIADLNYLQIKLLNTSKGPGVQSLRAQEDKLTYPSSMQDYLSSLPNLEIREEEIVNLIVENGVFKAAVTKGGEKIYAKACILTTGTYLDSEIMRGTEVVKSGPDGCVGAYGLAACLKNLGIKMFRLKTGTPPRLKKDTIDFSGLEKDEGSKYPLAFSYDTKDYIPFEEQLPCYITYTNKNTHEIIYKHLKESSMYNGIVVGTGPRYCPSIETKLVRFSSKERHQLFLEPESRYTDSIYLQGFSNSMPEEVQVEMVHSIKGLEHAEILKYAYAIEYEAIEPLQFDKTLMLRKIKGLFGAGQIIGTSGYEEAAALGLMAGINARNYIENKPGFILERDEAYIGIMIDDLVTKGTKEPYRLLSSRSEYRLLTRSDNADMRLMEKGYEVGLNSEERYQKFLERKRELERGIEVSKHIYVGKNKQVSSYCAELGFEKVDPNTSYFDLIKRQGVNYYKLSQLEDRLVKLDSELSYKLEIEVKYEGYIRLQLKEVERMHQYEGALLPSNIDYHHIDGLSLEAREALDKIRPGNIGEAMRITSVHPSDINVLLLYIRNYSKKNGL